MEKVILTTALTFFILIGIVSAQFISITSINPSSLTLIKNQEFSSAITYTITGTFDSCYLKVDEASLPTGWQLIETNPKQIVCSSGTSSTPKILATTTGSAYITIVVEGKGTSPKQDTESFYVIVKEGAILDVTLISPSTINVEKGKTYRIEFNVKNKGDLDSENAVASITCPTGYSCPSSLSLKEGQQANGVIRAGYTSSASFEIKAGDNPASGYVTIKVSATNSPVTDKIKVYLSYTPPEVSAPEVSAPAVLAPAPAEKLKNVTSKLKLTPGVGLRNNTKLQNALAKILKIAKLSEEAIENMMRLSESIVPDIEVTRKFKIEANRSILSMEMKYKGEKRIINFVVWDKIPKTFAEHVNNITVYAPGATIEVVEVDPEYVFLYPTLDPNQTITIVYETSGEKDASLINETEIEVYAEALGPPITEKIKICNPGTRRCVGNDLQECSVDGSTWKTIQICEWGCDPIALKCKEKPTPPVNYIWLVAIVAIAVMLISIWIYWIKYKRVEISEYGGFS